MPRYRVEGTVEISDRLEDYETALDVDDLEWELEEGYIGMRDTLPSRLRTHLLVGLSVVAGLVFIIGNVLR